MASQEHFDFYMTLAKPLALSLTNTDCRARACAWLKFLLDCEDSQLKLDYIKLLMFAMQKNNLLLLGPFSEVPPSDGALLPFPDNASLSTMMLLLTEKASGEVGAGDSKPQVTEFVSPDSKQFVALQTLPGNRGIQCYMALGNDEMNKWEQTTSSSCSCNNLTDQSGPSAPPMGHLQPPAAYGHAPFPPRYSPMVRYQRQRRRMDQMPNLPPPDPNVRPQLLEPTWIPTKEEVYWLKRMNKMIKRPGGPDTIFMDDVKRYEHADRTQATDLEWDPYQAPLGAPSDAMAEPVGGVQMAAEDLAEEFPEEASMEVVYPQTSTPQPQMAAPWPVYQQGYPSAAPASYPGGRPPGPTDDVSYNDECSPCSPEKSRPRWAKRHLEFDISEQSEKFHSMHMENPQSQMQYDQNYSQSHGPSRYAYDQSMTGAPHSQRSFPVGGGRGPPGPMMFPSPHPPRRPVSPGSDMDDDPSHIVVFHCQCACKK